MLAGWIYGGTTTIEPVSPDRSWLLFQDMPSSMGCSSTFAELPPWKTVSWSIAVSSPSSSLRGTEGLPVLLLLLMILLWAVTHFCTKWNGLVRWAWTWLRIDLTMWLRLPTMLTMVVTSRRPLVARRCLSLSLRMIFDCCCSRCLCCLRRLTFLRGLHSPLAGFAGHRRSRRVATRTGLNLNPLTGNTEPRMNHVPLFP